MMYKYYLRNKYMSIFKDKTYLITTDWAYPFGGGEEFLYQTMDWANNLEMNCYWLCFSNRGNPFDNFDVINQKNGNGKIIKIPGGFTQQKLHNWLILFNPDIVHHQGHMRKNFYISCEKLRIKFMSGYHFWTGAILLNDKKSNINIVNRITGDSIRVYDIDKRGIKRRSVPCLSTLCVATNSSACGMTFEPLVLYKNESRSHSFLCGDLLQYP